MRADGSVSAMKATDLKEVADRDRRIHQLEAQCATLAAEVDAQRPIVEAAIKWNQTNYLRIEWIGPKGECLRCYQEAKGAGDGN